MKRDDFDKQFCKYREHLRQELHRYVDAVDTHKCIDRCKSCFLTAMNVAPGFFRVVEDALLTKIVLWADKLTDPKGERGMHHFIGFVERNRKWLSVDELKLRRNYPDGHWMLDDRQEVSLAGLNQDRQKVETLKSLQSIRTLRDKYHAHFDKEYFFDVGALAKVAPLTFPELDDIGSTLGAILNDYSVDFDGTQFSWRTIGIDDIESLLRLTNIGIETMTKS